MKTAEQEFSTHVSVPSDKGVRVDKAITIERPVAEVYSFWRRLDNLPQFMRHVESVVVRDDLHSHWAVETVAGKVVEWDAEIIEQRENEMISWRSVPGADVDNAGSVWFTPVPGNMGTVLRVSLLYVPPAGKAGALVAKLFGRDAETEIAEDLQRLKCLLETGELPEEKETVVSQWQRRAKETARKATQATDRCVRENAWTVVTTAAFAGLILGLLTGQRSSRRAFRECEEEMRNRRARR